MNKELIVLEQLPVIKYHLEELSKEIKKEVDSATKLVVTTETVKEVKQVRANLTKDFEELERQRKKVKEAIMFKYKEFEEIYKENVSYLYLEADKELKEKIENVENQLKEIGTNNVKRYFEELRESLHLENIVEFDNLGLNITLTNLGKNLEGTKYKEEIKAKLDSIASDISLINLEEYKEEIMLEYKNTLDFAKSKLTVVNRHQEIDKIKEQQEKIQEQVEQEQKIEEKVDEIIAPIEIENEKSEEIIESTFTVKGTLKQLKLLKEFLESGGYEYE